VVGTRKDSGGGAGVTARSRHRTAIQAVADRQAGRDLAEGAARGCIDAMRAAEMVALKTFRIFAA